MKERSAIVIVGAGIAGLMTAWKFSQYGIKVIVIEDSEMAGNGSTTRNQGWLHAGAQHAQSIQDPVLAESVSRRCQYGHDLITQHYSESVIEPMAASIAFTMDHSRVSFLENRWRQAGVQHKQIAGEDFAGIFSNLNHHKIKVAWRVKDSVVNTRLLCQHLINKIRGQGGVVHFNAKIQEITDNEIVVTISKQHLVIKQHYCVIAAGYRTNDFLSKVFGMKLPLRYWKSHLLVAPKITASNAFCVDSHEVSFLQHEHQTLIGMLHDNMPCSEWSTTVDKQQIALMKDAVSRLIDIPDSKLTPVACVKVDIEDDPRVKRNLDIAIVKINPNVCAIFPGKMTEAPYLADTVLKEYLLNNDRFEIHRRPVDNLV